VSVHQLLFGLPLKIILEITLEVFKNDLITLFFFFNKNKVNVLAYQALQVSVTKYIEICFLVQLQLSDLWCKTDLQLSSVLKMKGLGRSNKNFHYFVSVLLLLLGADQNGFKTQKHEFQPPLHMQQVFFIMLLAA